MDKIERLGSRLGFIMLSAGCAIGCGNVWKFPWMCGQFGGGGFEMEIATAAANLTGGADAVVMRHPAAVAAIKKFINELI